MMVATKYQHLLWTDGHALWLLHLIPSHIDLYWFQSQTLDTQILTFLQCLFLLVFATDDEDTLVKTTEDA